MKKGITISILVVTVILMFTIVTTATVVGTRSIQTALYEEFLSKIERVSNDVNKYVIENKSLPTTLEIIAKEGLPNGLKAELNNKKDAANNLYVVDMTKLRTESVNIGKGSVEDMDVFIVAENTNNVYYLKGVKYRGTTYYGLDVVWTESSDIPSGWEENVVAMVDTVPIPKGFVASSATGENTKNGGLVIYEGTETVTDANVEDAKRSRNQYVWVPVEDFEEEFVRGCYENKTYSNKLGDSNYWEIVLDLTTNMPDVEENKKYSQYITDTTLAEVQAMYESVKEYNGFYIARYEAGIDTQRTAQGNAAELPGIKEGTKVYSVMGKIPYTYIPWTWNNTRSEDTNGAVEVARRMYPATNTNYGVVSTLTYGVQWDRTLAWWLEVVAKDGNGNVVTSVTNSTGYGNYADHVINSKEELNEDALVWDYTPNSYGSYVEKTSTALTYPKSSGTGWGLSTGALKVASVNNIYDMAGNMDEWTMEGYDSFIPIRRGGRFWSSGSGDYPGYPVSNRNFGDPDLALYNYGFRPALYIKK